MFHNLVVDDKLSKITAKAQSRLLLEELAEFYPEVIIDT